MAAGGDAEEDEVEVGAGGGVEEDDGSINSSTTGVEEGAGGV